MSRPWRELPPEEQIRRCLGYREDAQILFGRSALVTGIPGPHARRRQAAVGAENRLAQAIAEFEERKAA